jgi:hypothetical protein
MVRDAAQLETALDAELWASDMLGSLRRQRHVLGGDQDAFFRDLLRQLARGRQAAVPALLALAEVDGSPLGRRALELVDELVRAGAPVPAWSRPLLDVDVTATAFVRDIADGTETVLVEAVHPDGDPHCVAVVMVEQCAVDIQLTGALAQIGAALRDEAGARLESIAEAEARERILGAIERTDAMGQPVGDDYAPLRALALMRAEMLGGE